MKSLNHIILFVLLISVSLVTDCNAQDKHQQDDVKKTKLDKNPYEALRNRAFRVRSSDIGITDIKDKTQVYGVIMDWNLGEAVATLVCFQTGDASLYLSSGAVFIGAGRYKDVRAAVSDYIKIANTFVSKARPTETNDLPGDDEVKFYYLTLGGTYLSQDLVANIEQDKSDLAVLFEKANEVISAIRTNVE